ncbi:ABC transporter ATP-binding protein [Nocardioides sp. AE5]|uniref:ABC transporter ATP-binding protein n=1 Tax=Nocardioides sp. AE5 TaxID=2962573 RepID=UPI002882AB65|nr:ABC transporter ATP-binding protein [Nocardioides sp. AE5]MDT0201302.1 ABC transporter ATP-binding protein [Nocardioides sp. AE5]
MPAENDAPATGGVETTSNRAGARATAAVQALAGAEAVAGGSKPDPILVADNVVRTFGGLKAVDVDHVEIQRGSITALIGPNGAGKTTFFNLLTGFDQPDTGTWTFNGQDISKLPAYKVARQGMVRTFQLTKSLARLTVLENLRLGAKEQRGERLWASILPFLWRDEERAITERAEELLEHFNLVRVRDDFAGSLSGGQRKLLEMARALMASPEMVMLDEPMAGVNPRLRQTLNDHIRGLREEGMTVVFVEHDMDVVRDVSDWVIVMAQGKVVAEGPPEEVMAQQSVIDAYLGAHHDAPLSLEEEEAQLEAAEDEAAREAEEETS